MGVLLAVNLKCDSRFHTFFLMFSANKQIQPIVQLKHLHYNLRCLFISLGMAAEPKWDSDLFGLYCQNLSHFSFVRDEEVVSHSCLKRHYAVTFAWHSRLCPDIRHSLRPGKWRLKLNINCWLSSREALDMVSTLKFEVFQENKKRPFTSKCVCVCQDINAIKKRNLAKSHSIAAYRPPQFINQTCD